MFDLSAYHDQSKKIPTRSQVIFQEIAAIPPAGNCNNLSVVIPASDKPYSNLAQAIQDSQITHQKLLDHEAFPQAQQNHVISTHKQRDLLERHRKRQSTSIQRNPGREKPSSTAVTSNGTRQPSSAQALPSEQNQIRYKVLHHIWGKNRNYIKNRNDKREKLEQQKSISQFLHQEVKAAD